MSEINDLAGYGEFLSGKADTARRQRVGRALSLSAGVAEPVAKPEPEQFAPLGDNDWRDNASCRPDLLPEGVSIDDFTPVSEGAKKRAKEVCNGAIKKNITPCPVVAYCLRHALDNDEKDGVWGGLDQDERRRLRRPDQTA